MNSICDLLAYAIEPNTLCSHIWVFMKNLPNLISRDVYSNQVFKYISSNRGYTKYSNATLERLRLLYNLTQSKIPRQHVVSYSWNSRNSIITSSYLKQGKNEKNRKIHTFFKFVAHDLTSLFFVRYNLSNKTKKGVYSFFNGFKNGFKIHWCTVVSSVDCRKMQ